MASTDLPDLLQTGIHASRPAATDVAGGSLYNCTTHSLIYQSDGATWTTWATLGTSGAIIDQGAFTYLDATEASAPSTPASGKVRLYAKSDGRIYSKDDAGAESGPFSAGGGGGSGYIAAISGETGQLYYWPLNEGTGTSYNEVNGGTDLANAGANAPAFGPALQKDLTGGSLVIPAASYRVTRTAITWPAQWTIEAWVCLAVTGSGTMFGQWNGDGAMLLNQPGEVRAYHGGSFTSWNPGAASIIGRHHALIGYDGTNCKFYWDGTQQASTARTALGTNVGGEFSLCSYSGGGGPGEPELISDVAVYNTFDAGRAAAHYALGA